MFQPLLKLVGRMQMLQSQIAAQNASGALQQSPAGPSGIPGPMIDYDEEDEEDEEELEEEGESGEEGEGESGEEGEGESDLDDCSATRTTTTTSEAELGRTSARPEMSVLNFLRSCPSYRLAMSVQPPAPGAAADDDASSMVRR